MVEAIVANHLLVQVQLHANHVRRTLVSILRVAGTVGVWNGQAIDIDILRAGSVSNTVLLNLAEQLHSQ